VRSSIQRFGDLWDLAKARGYEVKKCWPEYVGLSSEAQPESPKASEGEPPVDPSGPQNAD
jgi:hypothetical protein